MRAATFFPGTTWEHLHAATIWTDEVEEIQLSSLGIRIGLAHPLCWPLLVRPCSVQFCQDGTRAIHSMPSLELRIQINLVQTVTYAHPMVTWTRL